MKFEEIKKQEMPVPKKRVVKLNDNLERIDGVVFIKEVGGDKYPCVSKKGDDGSEAFTCPHADRCKQDVKNGRKVRFTKRGMNCIKLLCDVPEDKLERLNKIEEEEDE